MKTNNTKEPVFSPMLFTCLKSYDKKQFAADFVSGIIVAIIALPLSIALALASGVGPEEGLYTAIAAGFIISLLGGSTVQIAGPTAAFATIVAGIVAKDGMSGLVAATILAGLLLVIMGLLRMGNLIKFIPNCITVGFTGGIAVTIVAGQLKDFFGITFSAGLKPIETLEKISAVVHCFDTANVLAVLVGVFSLIILIFWPRVPKVGQKIPASLIAVLFGIFLVKLSSMYVNTIGDLYVIRSGLPKLKVPEFSFDVIKNSIGNAATIAILAAIESLLSCVVADTMTGDKHRPNTELIAQGLGNIGSALFGGIPATGAIARTAANIKNNGKTPVAGIVHALLLILVLVVLMPFAALIPMPTIAAILFVVAYNMCGWRKFVAVFNTKNLADISVLMVTFILTVCFDLVVAIIAGLALFYIIKLITK